MKKKIIYHIKVSATCSKSKTEKEKEKISLNLIHAIFYNIFLLLHTPFTEKRRKRRRVSRHLDYKIYEIF